MHNLSELGGELSEESSQDAALDRRAPAADVSSDSAPELDGDVNALPPVSSESSQSPDPEPAEMPPPPKSARVAQLDLLLTVPVRERKVGATSNIANEAAVLQQALAQRGILRGPGQAVKIRKVASRLASSCSTREAQVTSIRHVWNRRRLHRGTQLAETAGTNIDQVAHHANEWTAEGCLRLAFEAIGRTAAHHQRETPHVLDAVAAVSAAAQSASTSSIKAWKQFVLTPHPIDPVCGFAVVRNLDATPVDITFPVLHSQLVPVKRYHWRAGEADKWQKTSL
jgi:hypothetical protein